MCRRLPNVTNCYQGRDLAFRLGLSGGQIRQFVDIFLGLAKLFAEKDLALIEVNPLVITEAGNLHCLDAKVVVDSNALYRHPDLEDRDRLCHHRNPIKP